MVLGLTEMIELGDPDELLREIDRRCEREDWSGVLEVQERCLLAVERGKQLWGVAGHAAYRLALEAPGDFAGPAIAADAGPLALGPLPEVAASMHDWEELAPFLPDGPLQGVTAHECVVLGDDLSDEEGLRDHLATFELPLRLQEWEPQYPSAEYRATEARFPRPALEVIDRREHQRTEWSEVEDDTAFDALRALVQPWRASSNGKVLVAAVEGGADEALSAMEGNTAEMLRLSPASALAWMAWAGASGGAYGRRSGMAAGRSKAWWAIAAISGRADDWPMTPEEVGEHLAELEWWTWNYDDSNEGWSLRLVIVDDLDGVTFAIDAVDSLE